MTIWRNEAPPRLEYITERLPDTVFDDWRLKYISVDVPVGHYLVCWTVDALLGPEDTRDNGESDLVAWFLENEIDVIRFDFSDYGWSTGRPDITYFATVDSVKAVMIKLRIS